MEGNMSLIIDIITSFWINVFDWQSFHLILKVDMTSYFLAIFRQPIIQVTPRITGSSFTICLDCC